MTLRQIYVPQLGVCRTFQTFKIDDSFERHREKIAARIRNAKKRGKPKPKYWYRADRVRMANRRD